MIYMHNILIMHYNNDKNKNALYDIQWRPCCYYAPSSNREFIMVEQDPSDWLTEHLERGILPDKATIFLTEHLFGNARESGKPVNKLKNGWPAAFFVLWLTQCKGWSWAGGKCTTHYAASWKRGWWGLSRSSNTHGRESPQEKGQEIF